MRGGAEVLNGFVRFSQRGDERIAIRGWLHPLQLGAAERARDKTPQQPLKLIDSAAMLDEARKWQDLFQKTIIGPSR